MKKVLLALSLFTAFNLSANTKEINPVKQKLANVAVDSGTVCCTVTRSTENCSVTVTVCVTGPSKVPPCEQAQRLAQKTIDLCE